MLTSYNDIHCVLRIDLIVETLLWIPEPTNRRNWQQLAVFPSFPTIVRINSNNIFIFAWCGERNLIRLRCCENRSRKLKVMRSCKWERLRHILRLSKNSGLLVCEVQSIYTWLFFTNFCQNGSVMLNTHQHKFL